MRNNRGITFLIICLLCLPFISRAGERTGPRSVLLNGEWEIGFNRHYNGVAQVPGIPVDPAKISNEKLWYKKQVKLPEGDWLYATLELKGARFEPEVFVNGEPVGRQDGGMAPVFQLLKNASVVPGNTITIEIALTSLKDVPQTDASYIPVADQWRSNVSSCLWDDVVLHLHGRARIDRIIPSVDFRHYLATVKFDLSVFSVRGINGSAKIEVLDDHGSVLIAAEKPVKTLNDSITFSYKNKLLSWSPGRPAMYRLRCTINGAGKYIEDQCIIPFGIKQFEIRNKQFFLNDEPCKLRGGTVVWHRWMRSEEGRELGFDTAWFTTNIVKRLKEHGANYLRFHLGKPPERFLDLCDHYGLLVQYEWSFFHGVPATPESIREQYRKWLDVAIRHPSVALIHPYNETSGSQLKTVWNVLDTLLKEYPPLVLEERDVIHIHKYWWSLFENLGLYYDDAGQFPKAIMADEFGGNYLDEKGDLGGYKSVKESYLRFLGRKQTTEQRLFFQAESNGKIAEYWRRIGAAGFAPFCMLSSGEDGNNWFLGKLKEGHPMPVWDALTAAFSDRSVSLDVWDRDYTGKQKIMLPVCLFNDTRETTVLTTRVALINADLKVIWDTNIVRSLVPFSRQTVDVPVVMPANTGDYTLSAALLNRPPEIKYPVVSEWGIHVFGAVVPVALKGIKAGVPDDEPELKAFLSRQHIATTSLEDTSATLLLTSIHTWQKIAAGDHLITGILEAAVNRGTSVIMLDAGERYLGQGYPEKKGDLGPLQGLGRVTDPKVSSCGLFGGITVNFTEVAEPESHLHPDKHNSELWKGIPEDDTRIWNGMRGGLIVPAADMSFEGLSADAFLTAWKSRGANEQQIKSAPCYAYELQGFFEFSQIENDPAVMKKLKDKVALLAEDAPALAGSINPSAAIKVTDLSRKYASLQARATGKLIPLANCGKNLTRSPVALIDFGPGKGKLILSQLLTAGRLSESYAESGFYGIRYDEVAVQMVLNMMNAAVSPKAELR